MLRFSSKVLYPFAEQKFIIKKSSYLVLAPPTRPPNAYNIFAAENLKGKKGIKHVQQKWKALSEAQKKPYQDKYKAAKEEYDKVKDQYNEVYVVPFKATNWNSLATSYIYSSKSVNVPANSPLQAYSQRLKELKRQLSPQQLQDFKKQAVDINTQRRASTDQFKFPEKRYHDENSYAKANPSIPFKLRTQCFKLYVKSWQNSVEQWLASKNINLSMKDFKRIYNKELRKEQGKRSQSIDEATLGAKAKVATEAAKKAVGKE